MRLLAAVAAFALVIGGGLVHGVRTQRWHTPEQLVEAAALVDKVPMKIGAWNGTAGGPADSNAQGWWLRRFENGNRKVDAVLECGSVGRMASFTPPAYFGAFETADEPVAATVSADGKEYQVMTTLLRKTDDSAGKLRVFCCWMGDKGWEAPDDVKWHFRGQPYLYRFCLACEASTDATNPLMAEWLPELAKVLGNGSEKR